jgi:hypothetical protein
VLGLLSHDILHRKARIFIPQGKLGQCGKKLLIFSVHGILERANRIASSRQYDLPVSKLMGLVIRDLLSLGNSMVDMFFHCSSYHGPN